MVRRRPSRGGRRRLPGLWDRCRFPPPSIASRAKARLMIQAIRSPSALPGAVPCCALLVSPLDRRVCRRQPHASVRSPAPLPAPDAFACVRDQIKAVGFAQRSLRYRPVAGHRAASSTRPSRRPDVSFRRHDRPAGDRCRPRLGRGTSATSRWSRSTFAELTTHRGPTEEEERPSEDRPQPRPRPSSRSAAEAPARPPPPPAGGFRRRGLAFARLRSFRDPGKCAIGGLTGPVDPQGSCRARRSLPHRAGSGAASHPGSR